MNTFAEGIHARRIELKKSVRDCAAEAKCITHQWQLWECGYLIPESEDLTVISSVLELPSNTLVEFVLFNIPFTRNQLARGQKSAWRLWWTNWWADWCAWWNEPLE